MGCGDKGRLQPNRHFLGSCGAEASIALWPGVLGCLCPLNKSTMCKQRSKQPLLSQLRFPFYLADSFSSDAFFWEKALTNHKIFWGQLCHL